MIRARGAAGARQRDTAAACPNAVQSTGSSRSMVGFSAVGFSAVGLAQRAEPVAGFSAGFSAVGSSAGFFGGSRS